MFYAFLIRFQNLSFLFPVELCFCCAAFPCKFHCFQSSLCLCANAALTSTSCVFTNLANETKCEHISTDKEQFCLFLCEQNFYRMANITQLTIGAFSYTVLQSLYTISIPTHKHSHKRTTFPKALAR